MTSGSTYTEIGTFFLRPVMMLQLHAVVGIERDLARNAAHDAGQALIARGVVFGVIGKVDLKFIVDRRLFFDWVYPVEFGLMASFGLGGVLIVAASRRRSAC